MEQNQSKSLASATGISVKGKFKGRYPSVLNELRTKVNPNAANERKAFLEGPGKFRRP